MKKYVVLSFCLLAFIAVTGPAMAATANFQANCAQGIPTDCIFDPNRVPSFGGTATSCPGSSVRRYFWDFGDGGSTFATPPPHTIAYTYTTGVQTEVCLTVFCNDNTSATTCHCMSNQIGFNGCIRNIGTWTP